MRSSASYDDTDDLLRLNTKHANNLIHLYTHATKSSYWEYTEFLLRPKMRIPNISYARNRQCRTNRTYRRFLTFETKQTEDFLQTSRHFRSVV